MSGIRYEFYDIVEEAGVPHRFMEKHGNKFGDCVVRACAFALNQTYTHTLYELMLIDRHCLRAGMDINKYGGYLKSKGWKWTKCKPHISIHKIPNNGTYLVELDDHFTVVKDGVNYDTDDWRRWAVHSYWSKK